MSRATPADFIDVRSGMARASHPGWTNWNRFTLHSREKISPLVYRYVLAEYTQPMWHVQHELQSCATFLRNNVRSGMAHRSLISVYTYEASSKDFIYLDELNIEVDIFI